MNWTGRALVGLIGAGAKKPSPEEYTTFDGIEAGLRIEDGVLISWLTPGKGACDLKYRNDYMTQMALLSPDGSAPLVADCTHLTWLDEEIFGVVANLQVDLDASLGSVPACAFVCQKRTARTLVNLLISIIKAPVHMRVFGTVEEAKEWAKFYRNFSEKSDHDVYLFDRVDADTQCPIYHVRWPSKIEMTPEIGADLFATIRAVSISHGRKIHVIMDHKNFMPSEEMMRSDWRRSDMGYVASLCLMYSDATERLVALGGLGVFSSLVDTLLCGADQDQVRLIKKIDSGMTSSDYSLVKPRNLLSKPEI